jgi:hypothetical protein
VLVLLTLVFFVLGFDACLLPPEEDLCDLLDLSFSLSLLVFAFVGDMTESWDERYWRRCVSLADPSSLPLDAPFSSSSDESSWIASIDGRLYFVVISDRWLWHNGQLSYAIVEKATSDIASWA